MNTVYSILFFAIIIVIIAIPIYLNYLLWTKVKFGKYLVTMFVCFFLYEFYVTLYPHDSFHIKEFIKITKQEFPKSGKIIKKYASLPDTHGDYVSCALIELSENDYKILNQLLDKQKSNKNEYPNSTCDAKWFRKKGEVIGFVSTVKEGGSAALWGLIKNKKQAFISYASW